MITNYGRTGSTGSSREAKRVRGSQSQLLTEDARDVEAMRELKRSTNGEGNEWRMGYEWRTVRV